MGDFDGVAVEFSEGIFEKGLFDGDVDAVFIVVWGGLAKDCRLVFNAG